MLSWRRSSLAPTEVHEDDAPCPRTPEPPSKLAWATCSMWPAGLIYCVEFLEQNLDWLKQKIEPLIQGACTGVQDMAPLFLLSIAMTVGGLTSIDASTQRATISCSTAPAKWSSSRCMTACRASCKRSPTGGTSGTCLRGAGSVAPQHMHAATSKHAGCIDERGSNNHFPGPSRHLMRLAATQRGGRTTHARRSSSACLGGKVQVAKSG